MTHENVRRSSRRPSERHRRWHYVVAPSLKIMPLLQRSHKVTQSGTAIHRRNLPAVIRYHPRVTDKTTIDVGTKRAPLGSAGRPGRFRDYDPDGHDGPDKAPRTPLRAGRRPRRPEPPTAQGRPADYAGPTVEGRGHLTHSRPAIEASHQRDPRCGIWTTPCPSTSTRRHRMRHLPEWRRAHDLLWVGSLLRHLNRSTAPHQAVPDDRQWHGPPESSRPPGSTSTRAGSRSSARRPVVVARAEVTGPVSNMPTCRAASALGSAACGKGF
jgi:hypothetical protein